MIDGDGDMRQVKSGGAYCFAERGSICHRAGTFIDSYLHRYTRDKVVARQLLPYDDSIEMWMCACVWWSFANGYLMRGR